MYNCTMTVHLLLNYFIYTCDKAIYVIWLQTYVSEIKEWYR